MKLPIPAVTFCFAVLAVVPAVAQEFDRSALGRKDKYRVLVDKVISPTNKWVFTAEHMKEIKDAGFNVCCPRIGGDNLERARRQVALAKDQGLFYMAWMRGTRTAKAEPKLVWQTGHTQNLCSPNSDELWDWMTNLIVGHARLSVEFPNFIGSFLDYENYAPNKRGNCYALSYDEKIMAEFAASRDIQLPKLTPARRYPWLKEKGLHDEFAKFQIDSWRQRCRKLRKQVDEINPAFQFIVYPAPGTLFMREAIWTEWATAKAPLILADACTYGRPSFFLDQTASLAGNRLKLTRNMQSVVPSGIPFLYTGGIDPVCRGADPEFCGKNAVMISEVTHGYWVFYEGPKYHKDHPHYFEWFKRANDDIAAGRFKLHLQKREEPDFAEKDAAAVKSKSGKPLVALFSVKNRLHNDIEKAGVYEPDDLKAISTQYLLSFKVIVLQNFNAALPADSDFWKNMRRYVEDGGGLFIVHDTGWFMGDAFPEIATKAIPKNNVEAGRHVAECDLVVAARHVSIGNLEPGTRYRPEFRDHMIFKPGPKGTVLIRNEFGDPVYVIGQCGKGRVAFSGSYYAYSKLLQGAERTAFFSILDWLAGGE